MDFVSFNIHRCFETLCSWWCCIYSWGFSPAPSSSGSLQFLSMSYCRFYGKPGKKCGEWALGSCSCGSSLGGRTCALCCSVQAAETISCLAASENAHLELDTLVLGVGHFRDIQLFKNYYYYFYHQVLWIIILKDLEKLLTSPIKIVP